MSSRQRSGSPSLFIYTRKSSACSSHTMSITYQPSISLDQASSSFEQQHVVVTDYPIFRPINWQQSSMMGCHDISEVSPRNHFHDGMISPRAMHAPLQPSRRIHWWEHRSMEYDIVYHAPFREAYPQGSWDNNPQAHPTTPAPKAFEISTPDLTSVATQVHDICVAATRRYIDAHTARQARSPRHRSGTSNLEEKNRFRRKTNAQQQCRRERKHRRRRDILARPPPLTRSRVKLLSSSSRERETKQQNALEAQQDELLPPSPSSSSEFRSGKSDCSYATAPEPADLLANISRVCSIIWKKRHEDHQQSSVPTTGGLEAEHVALRKMQEVMALGENVWNTCVKMRDVLVGENEMGDEEEDRTNAVWDAVEDGRTICEILADGEGLSAVAEVWDGAVDGGF
ncbi:hypothetical protein QBC43DRAFT_102333 [Cladorrhinum sp. PSN259]|nr:hypothetical protein QBC43DRAFT_102333 [Cladorrhinum sp. PSN259]